MNQEDKCFHENCRLLFNTLHEPIHVHAKYQDKESKAEIFLKNGRVKAIKFRSLKGGGLPPAQMKHFKELASKKALDIVEKWIDFVVKNKSVKCETIHKI